MKKLTSKDYDKICRDNHFYVIDYISDYSSGSYVINRTHYNLYEKDIKKLFADCEIISITEKVYRLENSGSTRRHDNRLIYVEE